jgi:hypothetical protein
MRGEEAKAWLLEMKKYFDLHDYPSRVEARIETYNLQGKTTRLIKPSNLMRRGSHGGSSKDISKKNICLSIIMKGR